MSLSRLRCHVKPERAKIPGISSQADLLLHHRRENSQLKTLFLLSCSKDFLRKKKQKAIHLALFVHSSMASSPGFWQSLPATPHPQHLQMPNRGCTVTSLCLRFWIRVLVFLSWKLPSAFVSQNKTCTRYCTTSQRAPHHFSDQAGAVSFLLYCSTPQPHLDPNRDCLDHWDLSSRNSTWASKPTAYTCLTHGPLSHLGQRRCRRSKAQEKHTSDVLLTGLHGHGDQVSGQVCCLSASTSGCMRFPGPQLSPYLPGGEDNHTICSRYPWGEASISL